MKIFDVISYLNHSYNEEISNDIKNGELLDERGRSKQLYLYRANYNSPVLLEIGRLRTKTFRHSGIGANKVHDLDKYDYYYDHLILWDDVKKIIVGGYRLMPCKMAFKHAGIETDKPIYTQTIYEYSNSFMEKYRDETVEIGRVFIRPSHWGSRSLDYLWFGMAHYFKKYSDMRYIICALSIPGFYPSHVIQLIIDYFRATSPDSEGLAKAIYPYQDIEDNRFGFEYLINNESLRQSHRCLNKHLATMGLKLPMLYKNTEVFKKGGMRFIDFGYDKGFSDACDGLLFADTKMIDEEVLLRYMGQ